MHLKRLVATATVLACASGAAVATAGSAWGYGGVNVSLPGNTDVQCQWLTGDYGYYGAGCAAGTEPINVGYTGAAWATYAGNLGAGQNFGGGVCVVGTCGLEFSYTDSGHLDSEACVEADPANIPLYGNCVYSRVP